jgi:hypothetical protein
MRLCVGCEKCREEESINVEVGVRERRGFSKSKETKTIALERSKRLKSCEGNPKKKVVSWRGDDANVCSDRELHLLGPLKLDTARDSRGGSTVVVMAMVVRSAVFVQRQR